MKLTPEHRDFLERIEKRMANGEPFTFQQLWLPIANGNTSHAAYRLADSTIQKWRKAGWISFTRRGRHAVWSLTEAGRKALEAET